MLGGKVTMSDDAIIELEDAVQEDSYQDVASHASADTSSDSGGEVDDATTDSTTAVESGDSLSGDAADGTTYVVLDDAQWSYLRDASAVVTTTALFTTLLICCLLGAVLFRYAVDGWRR